MTEHAFTNAAIEAAHAFRSIMQAMSRPGVPVDMTAAIHAPAPLNATAAAVALTLCDFQTPVWLAPSLRHQDVERYLKFHTGAPITGNPEEAQFAFVSDVHEQPDLQRLSPGTHEYPDRSATLVLQVPGFRRMDAVLSGPGIKGRVHFGVEGLGQPFWAAMAENHARFPMGVDVILAAPGGIAALPRSTAVRLGEMV